MDAQQGPTHYLGSFQVQRLTISRRRSLSYRNQFINLHSKSMGSLLYDMVLRHERVKVMPNLVIFSKFRFQRRKPPKHFMSFIKVARMQCQENPKIKTWQKLKSLEARKIWLNSFLFCLIWRILASQTLQWTEIEGKYFKILRNQKLFGKIREKTFFFKKKVKRCEISRDS